MSRRRNRVERKQKKQKNKQNIKFKKYEEEEIVSLRDIINSIVRLEEVDKEIYREIEG